MVREHSKILNFRISDIFNYPVSYDVDNACKVILRQIFEISWTIIVKFNFKKLNLIFSSYIEQIFPKFSGEVEVSIVYRYTNFKKI